MRIQRSYFEGATAAKKSIKTRKRKRGGEKEEVKTGEERRREEQRGARGHDVPLADDCCLAVWSPEV